MFVYPSCLLKKDSASSLPSVFFISSGFASQGGCGWASSHVGLSALRFVYSEYSCWICGLSGCVAIIFFTVNIHLVEILQTHPRPQLQNGFSHCFQLYTSIYIIYVFRILDRDVLSRPHNMIVFVKKTLNCKNFLRYHAFAVAMVMPKMECNMSNIRSFC